MNTFNEDLFDLLATVVKMVKIPFYGQFNVALQRRIQLVTFKD